MKVSIDQTDLLLKYIPISIKSNGQYLPLSRNEILEIEESEIEVKIGFLHKQMSVSDNTTHQASLYTQLTKYDMLRLAVLLLLCITFIVTSIVDEQTNILLSVAASLLFLIVFLANLRNAVHLKFSN